MQILNKKKHEVVRRVNESVTMLCEVGCIVGE
jgi:hypothetical protein